MKQFYAADLKVQSEITDFFMIKSAGIKVYNVLTFGTEGQK